MGFRKTSKDYNSAAFLMASLFVGPNYKKIANLLRMNKDKAYAFSTIARRQKIFVGDDIRAQWSDPKNGSMAFCCGVLVLEGKLHRDKVTTK